LTPKLLEILFLWENTSQSLGNYSQREQLLFLMIKPWDPVFEKVIFSPLCEMMAFYSVLLKATVRKREQSIRKQLRLLSARQGRLARPSRHPPVPQWPRPRQSAKKISLDDKSVLKLSYLVVFFPSKCYLCIL
jgi:hypothetical protein